jgi:hypothetical protein
MLNSLDNLQIIKILGGFGVILTGLSIFISRIVFQKMVNNWQHKHNIEILELKGIINQNNGLSSNLINLYGNSYQKILEKRLEASQIYWNNILRLRALIPSPIALANQILLEEEMTFEILNENKLKLADQIRNLQKEEILTELSGYYTKMNEYRIYISDNLWLLFYTYLAFVGREIRLFTEGVEKKDITHWRQDTTLHKMLQNVISKDELDYGKPCTL